MSKQFNDEERRKIIGLGKNSIRKNYFQDLKKKRDELEVRNENLVIEIEKRKEIEEELKELNTRLEEIIRERTEDLVRTNQYLEESMAELRETQDYLIKSEKIAALSHVIKGIAHEVNTPLGACITSSSYIKKITKDLNTELESGKLSKKKLEHYIYEIISAESLMKKGLDTTVELMENLKLLAIEKKYYERTRFKVCETLEFIVKGFQLDLEDKNITVNIECDRLLSIVSYTGVLKLVITNFLKNSINHAFDGKKDKHILIQFRKTGAKCTITYEDNGVGIPNEMESKIFDPFFTTKFGQGSSGMGLYVVYEMVTKQLNGDIEIHSENGLKYIIEFPEK